MAEDPQRMDIDPIETQEWREALDAVLDREGEERAHFLLEELIDQARRSGTHIPYRPTTAYLNTIPAAREERSPGEQVRVPQWKPTRSDSPRRFRPVGMEVGEDVTAGQHSTAENNAPEASRYQQPEHPNGDQVAVRDATAWLRATHSALTSASGAMR